MKPLGDTGEVITFGLNQTVPESCKLLVNLKITGKIGACGFQGVVDVAKKHARKTGVKKPDIFNSCYHLKVDIYFYQNIEGIFTTQNSIQDSITKSKFIGKPTFAILYVYTPENIFGAAVGYDISLDDSIICRAKNNFKYEIKRYEEGKTVIWAKKRSKYAVTLDIKFGEDIF